MCCSVYTAVLINKRLGGPVFSAIHCGSEHRVFNTWSCVKHLLTCAHPATKNKISMWFVSVGIGVWWRWMGLVYHAPDTLDHSSWHLLVPLGNATFFLNFNSKTDKLVCHSAHEIKILKNVQEHLITNFSLIFFKEPSLIYNLAFIFVLKKKKIWLSLMIQQVDMRPL